MNPIISLIPYLGRHRGRILVGVLALLASDAFQMTGPWIMKNVVDGLENGMSHRRLGAYALVLVGIAVAGGLFRYLMRRHMIGASRLIEYELRRDFFEHLTRLSFSFFNRTPTGDLMARATNDLNAVRMVLGPGIMYSINTVVTLAAAMTLMMLLSAKLTLIALIPMPLISIFMYRFGRVIHRRFEAVQEQFSTITAGAQEYLSGVRVVRAYALEERAQADFLARNREYLDRSMHLVRAHGLLHPAIGFLAGTGTVLVLLFGGRMVMDGVITVGAFVAFFSYLGMLIWPMIALGWVVSIFQRGAASMKRVRAILDAPPDVDTAEGAVALASSGEEAGELEFRDIRFAYPSRPETTVLDGITLTLRAGETVGIAGRTGSGKTTLVNLVPRLYDPQEGAVLLDGRDLREIPVADLRAEIGYVPQEAFLFSRSIADNIAFGRPEAPEEDVRWAADLARLSEDVTDFPNGFDTMVGERGVTLSGGQKQRAAIARALLRRPRVLILDDALASVDTRTEEAILAGLRDFMKSRTTLLVAHRVSTLRLADRIVMLEDGRIVEEGTHEELVALGGAYADLARLQEIEDELEAAL